MKIELKPCPFCGGQILLEKVEQDVSGLSFSPHQELTILCVTCNYRMVLSKSHFEKTHGTNLFEVWNRRVDNA